MYVMFGLARGAFPSLPDDVVFTQRLLAEENVLMLPGAAFNIPHFVRLVFCAPLDKLGEALDRTAAFCARHRAPAADAAPPSRPAATTPAKVPVSLHATPGSTEVGDLPHPAVGGRGGVGGGTAPGRIGTPYR